MQTSTIFSDAIYVLSVTREDFRVQRKVFVFIGDIGVFTTGSRTPRSIV